MKNKILTKIIRKSNPATSNHCLKDDNNLNSAPLTEEFERCIVCGTLTNIPVSMPIDLRENYEVGLGQICAECAKEQR